MAMAPERATKLFCNSGNTANSALIWVNNREDFLVGLWNNYIK